MVVTDSIWWEITFLAIFKR